VRVLVTGAAGFIGRAACSRLVGEGHEVVGLDSFVKPSAAWPSGFEERYRADVRDLPELPIRACDAVIHLAAQTAVTRSYDAPRADFLANAAGTFEVCLWARSCGARVIYASTNKVYGDLEDKREPTSRHDPIDPRTPYGVSKATGALYVRELVDRGYVFHQSCIYGLEQQGTIDQGWVSFVARQIRLGRPICCFGDGTQVRDLLHVDDLVRCYLVALRGDLEPGSYVVGGGSENARSFSDVIDLLGGEIASFGPWRLHDQRYFVSLNDDLPWSPRVDVRAGIEALNR